MSTSEERYSVVRAGPDVAQLARDFLKAEQRWRSDPQPRTFALMNCRKLVLEASVLHTPAPSAKKGGMKLTQHPPSATFPAVPDEECQKLKDDIGLNGQREPALALAGERGPDAVREAGVNELRAVVEAVVDAVEQLRVQRRQLQARIDGASHANTAGAPPITPASQGRESEAADFESLLRDASLQLQALGIAGAGVNEGPRANAMLAAAVAQLCQERAGNGVLKAENDDLVAHSCELLTRIHALGGKAPYAHPALVRAYAERDWDLNMLVPDLDDGGLGPFDLGPP
ncbi:hypothetical protein PE066_13685 [Ramlibacter tataouinensis]|uniref:hypothetical protein n=1 Tax=Ramlibacter tataouinensis TaxID=94132 RepID=UPI0022F38964|nr:hypothetical protein [Ramlibacter tataouinensis]WBY00516.1 hypothetical protein PE066_13685 [Ramlibacter tataouinensis]